MPCVPPEVDLAGYLLPRGFIAIPLRVNALGHFEIAVTVEGHTAQSLRDTGASHTVCVARPFRQFSAQSGTAVNSPSCSPVCFSTRPELRFFGQIQEARHSVL